MNFECHHCGIPFIRPYRMNITRASRPQFCSQECVGRHAEAKAEQRFASRFWSRVNRGADNACWPWTGRTDSNGYGRIDWKGKPQLAHRVAFFLSNPDADPECNACHDCDNPPCCNPSHLWGGSQSENVADMDFKGRRKNSTRRGEASNKAKLTAEQAAEIFRSPESNTVLGRRFGVTATAVALIKKGRNWAHVTGANNAA